MANKILQKYIDTTAESGSFIVTDGNTSTSFAATSSFAGGGVGGFKNKLINADFRINQRSYTHTTITGSGLYCFDRWAAGVDNSQR